VRDKSTPRKRARRRKEALRVFGAPAMGGDGGGEKGVVRRYVRSRTPRMHWTAELHSSFLQAIRCLGGECREFFSFFLLNLKVVFSSKDCSSLCSFSSFGCLLCSLYA
jgi:hypothetical protein